MSTRTYVLEGKQYTVPADTSMDELDQYIRGQSTPTSPDLKTGAGMQERAQQQAHVALSGANPWLNKPRGLESQQGNIQTDADPLSKPNYGEPLSPISNAIGAQTDRETKYTLAMQRAKNAPTPFTSASSALLPVAAMGARGALPWLAKTTLGGAAGSALGGYGGGEIGGGLGKVFNKPEWEQWGRRLGSLVGGVSGSIIAGRGGTVPGKGTMLERIFGGGVPEEPNYVPASESPGPYRGPSSVPKPPKPAPEVDPVAQAVKARRASWIPTKMPSAAEPVAPEVPNSEGPAPPTGKLYKLPVPREPLPGENPAYMASTKRNRLLNLGRQARPGAGDQLRNIGNTVLYTPETGYAPPKEVIPLEGNPTPFEAPKAPIQVQTDSLGVRWAHDGTNKVSIPRSVPDEGIEEYARPKLAEQAQIRSQLPWMRGQS